MKNIPLIALVVCVLSGCSQADVAQRGGSQRHVAYVGQPGKRPDYFKERRTITGSNIPIPADQLTFGPVSANTPSESFSRERPSLYPTVPVVGATQNTEPGTGPSNVGAGPAGSNPLPSAE